MISTEAKRQKENLKVKAGENTTEEHPVGSFLAVTTPARPSPTSAVGCCLRSRVSAPVAVTVISDRSDRSGLTGLTGQYYCWSSDVPSCCFSGLFSPGSAVTVIVNV